MFQIFKKIKQKLSDNKQYNSYKHLLKNYSLSDINFLSQNNKVLILKHSPRCIVSKTIMKEFIKFYEGNKDRFYYVVIDVIENRNISNQISENYKIIHQSPQILLIENEECIYSEDRDEINFNKIDNDF